MKKLLLLVIPVLIFGLYWSRRETVLVVNQRPTTDDKQQVLGEISISTSPAAIIQGEPVLITVNNLGTSTIKSLTVDGKKIPVFIHEGKPSALVGIDLRGKIGSYPIILTLDDGQKIESKLIVGERVITKAPLGIPDELGGNTPEAERELINTLVKEGAVISAVPTSPEKLWDGPFRLPIEPPITITDVYGYSRQTGASSISHKGTDFRAALGTPVYAMNSGMVRLTTNMRNYGNVIVIDHGLGLHTIYMHLSEILTKNGDTVAKGQLIAKSGATGYVLGPHLHLTVRINGISIDPLKFMALLGEG
ncbi:MAG: M23 family metallopeptidase [bacterium]|nr:M23 family metallopeptidase [bacterium]